MHTRRALLVAVEVAADLMTRPEVGRRWDDESACAGLSIGGLAHHLGEQAASAVRLLTEPPNAEAPITLAEHYGRAAWVTASLDEAPNVGIRDGAEALAASGGPEALASRVQSDLAALPALLEETRSPDTVHLTWQGWSLTTTDFLVSRMMEVVVHTDDLAASIDVPTPEFPDAVLRPVLGLLTDVAVRRHGQAALVRALARPQRAPASVSAF